MLQKVIYKYFIVKEQLRTLCPFAPGIPGIPGAPEGPCVNMEIQSIII